MVKIKKNNFLKFVFSSFLAVSIEGCNLLPPANVAEVAIEKKVDFSSAKNPPVNFLRNGQELEKAFGFKLAGGTRYDDSDPSITYAGNWETYLNGSSNLGSYRRNNGRNTNILEQDQTNETNQIQYVLPENWTTVSEPLASGGSYAFNNGKPASYKEENDPSITYTGNWVARDLNGESFYSIKGSDGPVLDENNSGSTNLKYSADNWTVYNQNGINAHIVQASSVTGHFLEPGNSAVVLSGSGWSTYTLNGTGFRSQSNAGGSAQVTFTGSSINIGVIKGFDRGIVKVTVYDQSNAQLQQFNHDLYAPELMFDVINVSRNTSGTYKVVIEPSGTKNSLSSGFKYDFVKAAVLPPGIRAITPANVTYKGSGWKYEYSAPEMYVAQNSGVINSNSIEFPFSGTNITFSLVKGINKGIVKVTVYDQNNVQRRQSLVNLYSITPEVHEVRFNALTMGDYRVVIDPTGTKDPASSGYGYGFAKALIYPSIEYNFTGTTVLYQALKDSGSGKVQVTLDGSTSTSQVIDLYSETTKAEVVKVYSNQPNTSHRLTIELLGEKNPSSSGYKISLDSFKNLATVTGSITGSEFIMGGYLGPNLGKMDVFIDNNFMFTVDLYSATFKKQVIATVKDMPNVAHTYKIVANPEKNTNATDNLIGFDYIGTGLPSFIKSIYGTDVTIYGNKGPTYGKINVKVDIGQAFPVDLYSPEYEYNQPLYSQGFSNATVHTIKVEQSFTKNEASTGYEFALDASGFGSPTASFSFIGTSLTLYGNKGPALGAVAVNLDGSFNAVDLYSPTTEINVPVKTFENITPGNHTVFINPAFGKNPLSDGFAIEFDGYEVVNSYQPAIISFDPPNGAGAEFVTITGSKFSKTLSENTVKINGLAATVVSVNDTTATPSDDLAYPAEFAEEIKIKVPFGVTQGKIEVTTTKGGTATSATDFIVNFSPHAVFNVSPSNGTTSTVFTVNASGTADTENNSFYVKYDWGDGSSSSYSDQMTATHSYSSDGYKVITMTVKDSHGKEVKTTRTVYVGSQTSGWASMAPIANGERLFGAAVAVNGKIYVVGGSNGSARNWLDEYNPVTNTWAQKAPLPVAAGIARAVEYNNKLVVYAGQIYVYDPVSNTWDDHGTGSADPITGRIETEMGIIGGKIYIAGGTIPATGGASNRIVAYNLQTGVWDQTLPNLPKVAARGASGVINGKFYFTGGYAFLDTFYYDSALNQWRASTAFSPEYRFYPQYAVINNKLYVAGGHNESGNLIRTVRVFDPVSDSWSSAPDIPSDPNNASNHGRFKGQGVGFANEFYLISGAFNTSNVPTELVTRLIP